MHTPTLQAGRKTKKTPAGNLPVDWGTAQLADIVESLEAGVSVNAEDAPAGEGELGVLKVSAVSEGIFRPLENKRVIPKESSRLGRSVRTNVILVSRSNTVQLVGACSYVAADYPNLFLPDKLWELRVRSTCADIRWLEFLLQSPEYRNRIGKACTGSSGSMKNVSQKSFLAMLIPLPPLPEQSAIAEVLESWTQVESKLARLLVSKAKEKRGLMQQLLTGKKRFKEFKGEKWRKVHLRDLLQEVDRYVGFADDHTYRLASVRRRSEGLFFREELRGSDIKTKVMKTIKSGDFLLSKMQVVHGAWGLVTPEFDGMFVSDSYIALVPRNDDQLSIAYFNYLSQTRYLRHVAFLACHGVHIEKMTFHLDDFLREQITIPPSRDEQIRIVEVLAVCDREIELLKKQLEALKEQKRGLMQTLLTGEIRVKVNADRGIRNAEVEQEETENAEGEK